MGRKIIKKTLDESKIKLEQDIISKSVNQSQSINEGLKEDNLFILEEIVKKRNELIFLDADKKEKESLNEQAKKDYIISNNKLEGIYSDISVMEKTYRDKLEDLDNLEETHCCKEKEFNKRFDKQESKLSKKVAELEKEQEILTNKKEELSNINKELLSKNTLITDEIDSKMIEYKKESIIYDNIKNDIKKLDDSVISSKISKTIIEGEIFDFEAKKSRIIEELKEKQKELDKSNLENKESKEELLKTRELNVTLIKKEVLLNERANHIKEYYRKAGITLNI